MLASLLSRLWLGGAASVTKIQSHMTSSVSRLSPHISMKPRDILGRSLAAGNWSTLIVIAFCYPVLLYFRGLDYQLLAGMVFMYASFWVSMVLLVLTIQVLWLVNYCISQRFVENYLDFEIVERILGQDPTPGWEEDEDEDEGLELDGEEYDPNSRLRATG